MTAVRAPSRRRRLPRRPRTLSVLGLTVVWLMLWGRVTPNLVLLGVLLAVAADVLFPLPDIADRRRPRPLGVLRLAGHVVVDLVVASIEVARLALRDGPRVGAAVVEVQLRTDSELLAALTAELLSLVPGSLVVELRRSTRTLFVHALGPVDVDGVASARARALRVEGFVLDAFGTEAERRRVTG